MARRKNRRTSRNGGLGGVDSFHVREANRMYEDARLVAEQSSAARSCTQASDLLQHAQLLHGMAKAHVASIPAEAHRNVSVRGLARAHFAIQKAQRDFGACLLPSRGRQ